MSNKSDRKDGNAERRVAVLEEVWQAGRGHSDALVFFHLEVARRLELNPTDYKTMSVLGRLGPMSARDIARHTGLTPASVTDLIDRLQAKGFVVRQNDPDDRRRIRVVPVAKRVAEIRKLFELSSAELRAVHRSYSDEELSTILSYLKINTRRLRAATSRFQD